MPAPEQVPVARKREESETTEPRQWVQAQLMSNEETVLPASRPRIGWLVAAGIAVFAGGVAGIWKFWEGERSPRVKQKPETVRTAELPSRPRPEVLAAAVDEAPPEDLLPPPAGVTPRSMFGAVQTAIARDVSTSPGVVVPVSTTAGPAPPESPDKPVVKVRETPAPAAGMTDAEKQIREAINLSGYLEKPGAAMIRFFAAATWQERLKYSLAPGKVKPLMESHYREYADGPIIPEDIELVRVEAAEEDPNRKYFAFSIYMPGIETGIPLSVEETVNGCLVEWCSFIEGKDRLLEKFYSGYRKEPGTFRVRVRLGHYFDNDVPDQDRKTHLIVRPPDGSRPFPLWVDRDSVAYTRHFATGERARWDISSMMVLSLQWERAPGGVEYVRLLEVVADSWHPALLPK